MADEPGGSSSGKGFWPDWLTPRRVWTFARNVVTLERSVTRLEQENESFQAEIEDIRRKVIEHDAQLRLLTTFVRDSLSNRLEARIEKLAAELVANKTKK